MPQPVGLDTRHQRLDRERLEEDALFRASWWAASTAFAAVTWLFLITLLF